MFSAQAAPYSSHWRYTLTIGILSLGFFPPLQKQTHGFRLRVTLKLLHSSLNLRIERQPITFIFTNPWCWLCYLTTYFIINCSFLKSWVLKLLFNYIHRILLAWKNGICHRVISISAIKKSSRKRILHIEFSFACFLEYCTNHDMLLMMLDN